MADSMYRWRIQNGEPFPDELVEVKYYTKTRSYHCSYCGQIYHGDPYCSHVIAVLVRRMRVTELAPVEVDHD